MSVLSILDRMSQALPFPPPGFDELTLEEQVEYVRMLSDRMAARHDRVVVPNWQLELIERSRADHEADPGTAMPWEEVPAAFHARIGRR